MSASVDGSKLISGTHNELRVAAHPLSGVQGVFSALSTNTRKIAKLCRSNPWSAFRICRWDILPNRNNFGKFPNGDHLVR